MCRECHVDEAEREELCYICYHDSVVDISIAKQNISNSDKPITQNSLNYYLPKEGKCIVCNEFKWLRDGLCVPCRETRDESQSLNTMPWLNITNMQRVRTSSF